MWPAFHHTVRRFGIPHRYFVEMIDGVASDMEPRRFDTFDELYRYCYQVASVVGLCVIHILGFESPQAPRLAEDQRVPGPNPGGAATFNMAGSRWCGRRFHTPTPVGPIPTPAITISWPKGQGARPRTWKLRVRVSPRSPLTLSVRLTKPGAVTPPTRTA